jgi:hypothetical protein
MFEASFAASFSSLITFLRDSSETLGEIVVHVHAELALGRS